MRSVSSVLAFVAATFAFASMSPGVGSATVAVIGDSESFDSTVLRAAGERAAQGEDVLGASSVSVVALRPKTAEITVRYHSVPADAQTAFEAAAAIWEGQFVSSTETIIDVTWAPLDESTLANAWSHERRRPGCEAAARRCLLSERARERNSRVSAGHGVRHSHSR